MNWLRYVAIIDVSMSRNRVLLLLAIGGALALYFPINRLASGGLDLRLHIDDAIPFWAPSVIPYLVGAAFFAIVPVWAALATRPGQFERYALAFLLVTAVSYVIYITFPTYVTRPAIVEGGIFAKLVALLYSTDRAYNAAPSGHTFYTVLEYLFVCRWLPRGKWIWALAAVAIVASTLLTKQHNVLDVAAGLIVALGSYAAVQFLPARKERSA